jgi:hypothetical protein
MQFKTREVVTPKMTLKIEIELENSTISLEEAGEKVERWLQDSRNNPMSSLITGLLRESRARTWDLKTVTLE